MTTKLNINNVSQSVDVNTRTKTFGQKLMEQVVEHTQEELPNGDVKITLIVKPKIKGVRDV